MKQNKVSYGQATKQLKEHFDSLQENIKQKYLNMSKEEKKAFAGKNKTKAKETNKRKRDPDAPKGPGSASTIFCQEKKLEYTAKYPRLTPKEVNKQMTKDWESFGPEQKAVYERKRKEAVEEYNLLLQKYKKQKTQNQSK
uniref:HMG box domain-containing protein n=1 Tax=Arcella intermedia TaxID=1963864 RepID=A0A6B2LP90_9EUKA